VMVAIDPPALSLDVPVPAPPGESVPIALRAKAPAAAAPAAAAPAPAAPAAPAAPLSARQPAAPIRLKKVIKTPPTGAGHAASSAPAPAPAPAPAAAFNALEADFFAREADLYKDPGADNFDDLEAGGETRRRPRTATPRGSKKR
jgi:pyruvate dehydrogenase E2 component (dihydrolipoyllysine-residue acetyltransferase)